MTSRFAESFFFCLNSNSFVPLPTNVPLCLAITVSPQLIISYNMVLVFRILILYFLYLIWRANLL